MTSTLASGLRLFKDPDSIQMRIHELGRALSVTHQGRNPLIIGLLDGAFVFLADLVRTLSFDCEVEFWRLKSYGTGTKSSGHVKELWPLAVSVQGRHVVAVEDIIDSGRTITHVRAELVLRQAASITVVSLLKTRDSTITVDHVGFLCGPQFVVGYGLDFGGQLRWLPALYYLME